MAMPSALSTLAAASGQTLEDILIAREKARLLAAQQAEDERKQALEGIRLQLSVRGDRRAEEATTLAAQRFAEEQVRRVAEAAQQQTTTNAATRAATNVRGLLDLAINDPSLTPTQRTVMQQRAMGAEARGFQNLPADTFVVPDDPETIERRRSARITSDAEARARVAQRFAKPAKPAKDNAKAPARFVQTIENRIGTPGFETADAALKSIQARWPAWRNNYPGLDVNAIRTALQNIYGHRVSSGQPTDALAKAVADAIASYQPNDDQ